MSLWCSGLVNLRMTKANEAATRMRGRITLKNKTRKGREDLGGLKPANRLKCHQSPANLVNNSYYAVSKFLVLHKCQKESWPVAGTAHHVTLPTLILSLRASRLPQSRRWCVTTLPTEVRQWGDLPRFTRQPRNRSEVAPHSCWAEGLRPAVQVLSLNKETSTLSEDWTLWSENLVPGVDGTSSPECRAQQGPALGTSRMPGLDTKKKVRIGREFVHVPARNYTGNISFNFCLFICFSVMFPILFKGDII